MGVEQDQIPFPSFSCFPSSWLELFVWSQIEKREYLFIQVFCFAQQLTFFIIWISHQTITTTFLTVFISSILTCLCNFLFCIQLGYSACIFLRLFFCWLDLSGVKLVYFPLYPFCSLVHTYPARPTASESINVHWGIQNVWIWLLHCAAVIVVCQFPSYMAFITFIVFLEEENPFPTFIIVVENMMRWYGWTHKH